MIAEIGYWLCRFGLWIYEIEPVDNWDESDFREYEQLDRLVVEFASKRIFRKRG